MPAYPARSWPRGVDNDHGSRTDVKWPEYYDGAAMFYEWTGDLDGYTRPFDNDIWEFRIDQGEATSDVKGGLRNIGYIDDGDYISYESMNLAGIDAITYRFASNGRGGRIEIHADSPDGPLVGDSGYIEPTGGWQIWKDVTVPIEDPGGTHELFFVFRNNPGDTGLFSLNYLKSGAKESRSTLDQRSCPCRPTLQRVSFRKRRRSQSRYRSRR